MARYVHEVGDQIFEIDVMPMIVTVEGIARMFVAYVSRLDPSGLVPIKNSQGKREIFGPTEACALRTARGLLDSGAWRTGRTARDPAAS